MKQFWCNNCFPSRSVFLSSSPCWPPTGHVFQHSSKYPKSIAIRDFMPLHICEEEESWACTLQSEKHALLAVTNNLLFQTALKSQKHHSPSLTLIYIKLLPLAVEDICVSASWRRRGSCLHPEFPSRVLQMRCVRLQNILKAATQQQS